MKLDRVVIVLGLALALAGASVACGPEQKYCYQQHTTCTQAELDRQNAEDEAEQARQRALDAGSGGLGDAATVLESGTGSGAVD